MVFEFLSVVRVPALSISVDWLACRGLHEVVETPSARVGVSSAGSRGRSHGRRRSSTKPRARRSWVKAPTIEPTPAVGLFWSAHRWRGPTHCVLDEAKRVFDVETPQIGHASIGRGRATRPRPKQPQCLFRLRRGLGQMLDFDPDDAAPRRSVVRRHSQPSARARSARGCRPCQAVTLTVP